jgi:hypothetical protein
MFRVNDRDSDKRLIFRLLTGFDEVSAAGRKAAGCKGMDLTGLTGAVNQVINLTD